MSDLNRVFLTGRLTKDPETKYTASGTALCKFSVAVNRWYKDKNNETQKEAMFINDITAWERLAENCRDFLKKGDQVAVEGRLKMDEWKDKEGNKRSKMVIQASSVVFGSKRREGEVEEAPEPSPPEDLNQEPGNVDNDIPF